MGISPLYLNEFSFVFSRYLDRNNLKNLTAGVFYTLASLMHLYVGMIYTSCYKERHVHPISGYQLLEVLFSQLYFLWQCVPARFSSTKASKRKGWDEFKRRISKRIFNSNDVASWNLLAFFFKETKWQEIQIFISFEKIEVLQFYISMSALLIVPIIFLFFRSLRLNNIQTLNKDIFLNLTSLTWLYVWLFQWWS